MHFSPSTLLYGRSIFIIYLVVYALIKEARAVDKSGLPQKSNKDREMTQECQNVVTEESLYLISIYWHFLK